MGMHQANPHAFRGFADDPDDSRWCGYAILAVALALIQPIAGLVLAICALRCTFAGHQKGRVLSVLALVLCLGVAPFLYLALAGLLVGVSLSGLGDAANLASLF